ncbi:hypothetical protein MKW98_024565 [Papaver atlanticum]|uniref:Peptidase A1 domain-containing protein n=1 Tax=Papaver atlanticum TaxID=357466 RepID=A0AAD4X9C5_9MAGN|nr:hypothetical protein MKW98_024565 [Papaver atlanticum]
MASSCSCSRKYLITVLLVFSLYFQNVNNCNAFQTSSFEMHHRFSDGFSMVVLLLKMMPCDCTTCALNATTSTPGISISNSSSTGKDVSCNSSLCELKIGCSETSSQCRYHVEYAANISSTGVLVQDVLRLKTDNEQPKEIDARIIFRPFRPWYHISVTQLSVGGNLSNLLDVSEIFYSDAQNTFLDDPVYTALCDTACYFYLFCSSDHKRSSYPTDPYEYRYNVDTDLAEARTPKAPNVALIMKGGSEFNIYNPLVPIMTNVKLTAYCFGVVKAINGNYIGNNFMTGYNIVFDREKMVLGWKASNCTDEIVYPSTPPKIPPQISNSVNGGTLAPMSPRNGLNSNKAPQF